MPNLTLTTKGRTPRATPCNHLTPAPVFFVQDFLKSPQKPVFVQSHPRDWFKVFIVEPQQSFARIRAQSGAFLISAFHEQFERDQILEKNPDIPVYDYYHLRVLKKKVILDELRLFNVTRESLFPGLEEAAKAVIQHYSAS